MHVTLFFTRNVSLQTWKQTGTLSRELALYRHLRHRGMAVSLVTYGDRTDQTLAGYLPGARICCNSKNLPIWLYRPLLPLLHRSTLMQATLFKTNQISGADVALRTARLYRTPLLVRCGYIPSALAASRTAPEPEQRRLQRQEQTALRGADRVVVTTAGMRTHLTRTCGIDPSKIDTIPNYVLTDLFRPGRDEAVPGQICAVGRLSEEKNLSALIDACSDRSWHLILAGDGYLRQSLIDRARRRRISMHWTGTLPHERLPELLRHCSLFVLASRHEGNPKTLLEAMACGTPVIGADSPGIRDIIRHGVTGWLCTPHAAGIRAAIDTLLENPTLRKTLARNAREFALRHCALEVIAPREIACYRATLAAATKRIPP